MPKRGTPCSAEHKERIAEGVSRSYTEGRHKLCGGWRHRPETRAKIRAAHLRRSELVRVAQKMVNRSERTA
jgi:hypothetical protein